MADGRETRAQIDSETVRGLVIINGGGAAALLAFLTAILGDQNLDDLSIAVVIAIFLFQVGLVAAIVHNRLRRKCSLAYAKKDRQKCRIPIWGDLAEPCICHWSIFFMWASVVSFLAAGFVVLHAALGILS